MKVRAPGASGWFWPQFAWLGSFLCWEGAPEFVVCQFLFCEGLQILP